MTMTSHQALKLINVWLAGVGRGAAWEADTDRVTLAIEQSVFKDAVAIAGAPLSRPSAICYPRATP
jgi:hypothetical protein